MQYTTIILNNIPDSLPVSLGSGLRIPLKNPLNKNTMRNRIFIKNGKLNTEIPLEIDIVYLRNFFKNRCVSTYNFLMNKNSINIMSGFCTLYE
jgi:hypothetical protein